MSNQPFVGNPESPRKVHFPPNRSGISEPNQGPDVSGTSLAHPGAPSHFEDRNRDIAPAYYPAPEPGPEVAGPAMFNLVQETVRALDVQSQLIVRAIPLLTNRIVIEKHAVQTDANGNADVKLYQVPQGMQFVMTRCVVEDAAHFAGTPFSVAGGWHAIIEGDRYQPGSIRDFAPNPPASNVPFIPWIYSDGNEESAVFRGGQIIGFHIVGTGTLANVDLWISLQGHESPI
jgi:hypothetical protein